MVWFIVDDGLATSPKVLGIPRVDRIPAMGLWVLAGSWCGQHLTDGAVPQFMVEELGSNESIAGVLVAAGLWNATSKGYQFKNWAEYQQSKSEVESKREYEREKKRRQRRGANGAFTKTPGQDMSSPAGVPAGVPEGVPGDMRGESPGESHRPSPTLPSPTNPKKKNPPSDADASDSAEFSDDVKRISAALAEGVRANGHRVGKVGSTWWAACDRLIRLDGYTAEQIEWLIGWTLRDEFWAANIRSMPKFREKFSTLKAQAQSNPHGRGAGGGQKKQTDTIALVAKYEEEERNAEIRSSEDLGLRAGRGPAADQRALGRGVA